MLYCEICSRMNATNLILNGVRLQQVQGFIFHENHT